jgi:hypothetical protein
MKSNRNHATHSRRALAGLCLAGILILPLSFTFGAETNAPIQAKPGEAQRPPLFLEETSPAGFARTLETLKAEVKAGGWSLLAVHDMAEHRHVRHHVGT